MLFRTGRLVRVVLNRSVVEVYTPYWHLHVLLDFKTNRYVRVAVRWCRATAENLPLASRAKLTRQFRKLPCLIQSSNVSVGHFAGGL